MKRRLVFPVIAGALAAFVLTACGGTDGGDYAARLRGNQSASAAAEAPSATLVATPVATATPDLWPAAPVAPIPTATAEPPPAPTPVPIVIVVPYGSTPEPAPAQQLALVQPLPTAYVVPAMPNVEPCPVVNGRIDRACAAKWRRP